MHELATCNKLIAQLNQLLPDDGEQSVKCVTLSVGVLTKIDTGELLELFPIVSQGTRFQNAELIIHSQPVQVECLSCRSVNEVTMDNLDCPQCGSEETRLVNGADMVVTDIEVFSQV